MTDSAPIEIRHNEAAHRFEALLDGALARCDYQRTGNVLRAYHTQVPRAFEGRGIAAALVSALLDYADRSGLKVEPACSYVRTYMRRHPESNHLLEPGLTL
jgi:predicted GNAT family acetyltransferase